MRKLGELGCTGQEARSRLERLFKMGLAFIREDTNTPLTLKEKGFLTDMNNALADNPIFEPSYGQVVWAQDIYNKYCL